MNFSARKAMAAQHEKAVAARLESAQWNVDPFGQGLLPERQRTALRELDTPLRWLPDLIASKCGTRPRIILVDAKTGWRTDTPNYCIEKSAIDADFACLGMFRLDVLLVTGDFRVLSPSQVHRHGRLHDGRNTNGGSGTPFYLVPKTLAKDFDAVFGEPAGVLA